MKISIETKFNIADIVYIAQCYADWFAYEKPCVITDIFISANSRTTHILYEIQQDDFVDRLSESWVFGTYEECAHWCDEHNKNDSRIGV